jgi:hypothetical protein
LTENAEFVLQITTLRAKVLPSLVPSNYEPHFTKNARYALSFITFAIGRLRKDTFCGKLFLLKGAIESLGSIKFGKFVVG